MRLKVSKYVKVGDTTTLYCEYDLGDDTLYTMKWYKGSQEFYRYTPKESPPQKTFPILGLQIDVSTCSLFSAQVFFNMSFCVDL